MALIDKLTAIANAIRGKTGKTAELTLDEMATEIAGIETELPEEVEQATPTITVSAAGLITASATQTEGYVVAGTKSATKQLSTQAAKTVTPSTSAQTAVASGKYTTGAIKVAAIPSTYKRVATGTFAGTTGLKGTPISVTGLGFTPTRVIAYLSLGGALGSVNVIYCIDGNGTTTKVTYIEASSYCEECGNYNNTAETASDTDVSLTVFSGGFRISATSNFPHIYSGEEYCYIAIG